MTKLQMIKRANGTVSYSVNIPLSILRDIGWEKGEKVSFRILDDKLLIWRDEVEDE